MYVESGSSSLRVSVGLPVFNGEQYIAEAIESILGQTMTDLELVVCDNASTDGTADIVREYAVADSRIKYVPASSNVGGAANFNKALELAKAPYFKWMAADDRCRPTFLEQCIQALDEDLGAVLAYSEYERIGPEGELLPYEELDSDASSEDPVERFKAMVHRHGAAIAQFGVVRSEVLRRSCLMGAFPGSDHVLLADLVLQGRFVKLPEVLLSDRDHADRSIRRFRTMNDRLEWWDPARVGQPVFPWWTIGCGIAQVVARSPLCWTDRGRCYTELAKWAAVGKRERLLAESVTLARYGLIRVMRNKVRSDAWSTAFARNGEPALGDAPHRSGAEPSSL